MPRSTASSRSSSRRSSRQTHSNKSTSPSSDKRKRGKSRARKEGEQRHSHAPTIDQQALTEIDTSRNAKAKRAKGKDKGKDKGRSKARGQADASPGKRKSRWARLDVLLTILLVLGVGGAVGGVYGVNVWSEQHGAAGLHPLSLTHITGRTQAFVTYLKATWGPPATKKPSLGYEREIQAAALHNHIDAALLKAVIEVESGFRPHRVDHFGAIGLMQIRPDRVSARGGSSQPWFSPSTNIHAGARYLSALLRQYKRQDRALLAYHYQMRELPLPPTAASPYLARLRKALRLYRRDPGHRIRKASRHAKRQRPRRSRLRTWIKKIRAYFKKD